MAVVLRPVPVDGVFRGVLPSALVFGAGAVWHWDRQRAVRPVPQPRPPAEEVIPAAKEVAELPSDEGFPSEAGAKAGPGAASVNWWAWGLGLSGAANSLLLCAHYCRRREPRPRAVRRYVDGSQDHDPRAEAGHSGGHPGRRRSRVD